MYTDAKQVQLLIVMLKEYGIKRIVISPGTRNFPLVHSIENDPDFICYSIVDERSASYFAMGLILETGEPVAVSCTSGTASANYHSAVCEAYYQKMPLILLTADRNPYYLDHRENQMIPQVNMYGSSCIKAVTIPAIKDAQDEWYCYRTLNEALLETERKEKGPIQINYVLEDWELDRFHTPVLPQLKKMERIFMEDTKLWEEKAREITSAKRVLVVFGQSTPPSNQLTTAIETFFSYTNSVISVDYTANLHCKGTLEMTRLMDSLQGEFFEEIEPDIVISMNNNYLNGIKWALKGTRTLFTHWDVNADGKLVDEYRQLSSVFACTPLEFFEQMNEYLFKEGQIKQEHAYYHTIEEKMKLLSDYDFEYSNLYVMKAFEKKVPAGANLHLGNIRSAYLAQFFPLSEQVRVYAHNGTTTIDGSLSTFVGQAAATDKLSFCFLGDLSFFYDMNALWNRYIKNTMRILLLNNGGGGEFHTNPARISKTVDDYTAAGHSQEAKAWAIARGFEYMSARNKEEFDQNLEHFMTEKSDQPIFFEVFTDIQKEADLWFEYRRMQTEILKQHKQELTKYRTFKKTENRAKLQANYDVCRDLLALVGSEKGLTQYFSKQNINTIAVYGLGEIGRVFYTLAKKSGIQIAYCIDTKGSDVISLMNKGRSDIEPQDITVIRPDETYEDVDAIVISVPFDTEVIKQNIKLHTKIKALTLREIIDGSC